MNDDAWVCRHCDARNDTDDWCCRACRASRGSVHNPEWQRCPVCQAAMAICRRCAQEVAASGADGGSWVVFPHRCTPRSTSVRTPMQTLEAENARLRAELQNTVTTAYHDEIVQEAVKQRVEVEKTAFHAGFNAHLEYLPDAGGTQWSFDTNMIAGDLTDAAYAAWKGRT